MSRFNHYRPVCRIGHITDHGLHRHIERAQRRRDLLERFGVTSGQHERVALTLRETAPQLRPNRGSPR